MKYLKRDTNNLKLGAKSQPQNVANNEKQDLLFIQCMVTCLLYHEGDKSCRHD